MLKGEERKEKIRARYKGVDKDELEFIPANPKTSIDDDFSVKRVAAYCRVSTDDPNQTSSYELQRNHYEEYIKGHENWELVDVYADEGISGTSMQHRDNFNRMIADCNAGKIDLIVTKSVSRFARNIVDCIKTVRELAHGKNKVGVLFETEHIYTLDGASEMMLAVLSAAAQEESHTKSEIMNISIEQRFSRGIFLTPELLGYDRDEDGNLVVNDEEAETVKVMYYLYINGFTFKEIADILTKFGRETKLGNTEWSCSSIRGVIQNERHCGDVLARKTWTPNYLDHKAKKNNNDRNQYRQRDHHEAIVKREIFEAANRKAAAEGRKGKPLPILSVIEGGALRGFVPVDRAWSGFSSEDYIKASESAYEQMEPAKENRQTKKKIRLDLSGYQRVRGEFFITYADPSMTISGGKIRFNTACLKRFESVEYVELLLNSVKKCIAIRPCSKENPNAIQWGVLKNEKWTANQKSCRGFARALYEIMEWDDSLGYKFYGNFSEKNGEKLILFELAEPEMQKKITVLPEDVPTEPDVQDEQLGVGEKEPVRPKKKTIIAKIPPLSWYSSFGRPVYDLGPSKLIEQIHYNGEWDVLRPAEPIEELNILLPEEIDELLSEAKEIIERWAV